MKNIFSVLLIACLAILTPPIASADRDKPHICFRTLDADQDFRVSWDEFHKGYADWDQDKYRSLDIDKDGVLSHEEYHLALDKGVLTK